MAKMKASAASDIDVSKVAEEMNSESERYAESQREQEKAYRAETDSVVTMMQRAQALRKQEVTNEQDVFVNIVANVPARAVTQIVHAVENQQDTQIIKPKMRLYWAGFISGVCLCIAVAAAAGIMVIA